LVYPNQDTDCTSLIWKFGRVLGEPLVAKVPLILLTLHAPKAHTLLEDNGAEATFLMQKADAWAELIRVLENIGVHHGRIVYYQKEQLYLVMRALYEIAVEEVTPDDQPE